MPGRELGLLFRRQHVDHLRHHSRVRNVHFNLDPGASFGGRTHRCFIEGSAHRVTMTFVQCAHLLVQRLITLAKTVIDFLNRGPLVISQV